MQAQHNISRTVKCSMSRVVKLSQKQEQGWSCDQAYRCKSYSQFE